MYFFFYVYPMICHKLSYMTIKLIECIKIILTVFINWNIFNILHHKFIYILFGCLTIQLRFFAFPFLKSQSKLPVAIQKEYHSIYKIAYVPWQRCPYMNVNVEIIKKNSTWNEYVIYDKLIFKWQGRFWHIFVIICSHSIYKIVNINLI